MSERQITFQKVPAPLFEQILEQRDGALQIIATLVLKDEVEGLDQDWIANMRSEILSPEWRPHLISVLQKHGFYTNTHPGFPLGMLEAAPAMVWNTAEAYQKLEEMLQAYAAGEGEDVENWVPRLVAEGVEEEIATWIMRNEGRVLASEAALERIVRPLRTAEVKS